MKTQKETAFSTGGGLQTAENAEKNSLFDVGGAPTTSKHRGEGPLTRARSARLPSHPFVSARAAQRPTHARRSCHRAAQLTPRFKNSLIQILGARWVRGPEKFLGASYGCRQHQHHLCHCSRVPASRARMRQPAFTSDPFQWQATGQQLAPLKPTAPNGSCSRPFVATAFLR